MSRLQWVFDVQQYLNLDDYPRWQGMRLPTTGLQAGMRLWDRASEGF